MSISSSHVEANTLFIGKNYMYLENTSSTNSHLKTLIAGAPLSEGTVVSAGFQAAGRGQAGTVWESAKGSNIILSVLLYPKFLNVTQQFLISKTIALAVRDFILRLLPEENVAIKWPNDILVSGKKICGILIENGLKGNEIEYSVCGLGINVNELQIAEKRISLKMITGIDLDLKFLERILLSCLEVRYLLLKSNPDSISRNYSSALHGLGLNMLFKDNLLNKDFEGIIKGVHEDGRLIVDSQNGIKCFSLKELSWL